MSRVEVSETIGPDPVTAIYSGNGMASGDVIGAVVRNDYVESKPFYTDNFLNHSYQVSLNPDVVTKPSNFNWKFDEDGNVIELKDRKEPKKSQRQLFFLDLKNKKKNNKKKDTKK